MAEVENSSSMGAVLYFGLIACALIAGAPGPVTYLNPKDTMKRTTFQEPPEDMALSVPFSWPVATQNVDAALVKTARLTMPPVTAGQAPNTPDAAPARPRLDDFIPISFRDPIVRVIFGTNSSLAPFQGKPNVLASYDASNRTSLDVTNSSQHSLGALPPATTALARPDVAILQTEFRHAIALDDALAPQPNVARAPSHQPVSALLISPPDTWSGRDDAPWTAVTTGDRVYLRQAPSSNGDPLDLIPIGSSVVVTQTRGDWVRIEVEDRVGWMFAEFVQAN